MIRMCVCVDECSLWYQPTWVVPGKGQLNIYVCVLVKKVIKSVVRLCFHQGF